MAPAAAVRTRTGHRRAGPAGRDRRDPAQGRRPRGRPGPAVHRRGPAPCSPTAATASPAGRPAWSGSAEPRPAGKIAGMTDLAENLRAVRARIDAAARAAGRDPSSVALLAVSKTWPADDVRALAALGQLRLRREPRPGADRQGGRARRPAAALALHRPAAAQQGRRRGPARRGRAHRRPASPSSRALDRAGQDGDAPGRRLRPGRPRGSGRASSRPAAAPRPPTCPALADLVAECPGLRLRGLMAVAPARGGPGAGVRPAGRAGRPGAGRPSRRPSSCRRA